MKVKYEYGYDFSNGVQIGKETIDKWTKEILDYLAESKEKYATLRSSSGNSMVIGIRHKDEIEIFEVTSGYTEHLYKIKRDK